MSAESLPAFWMDNHPRWEPNVDLLRLQGWSIISADGPYCTAWKGSDEILLVWLEGSWHKVFGGFGIAS